MANIGSIAANGLMAILEQERKIFPQCPQPGFNYKMGSWEETGKLAPLLYIGGSVHPQPSQ